MKSRYSAPPLAGDAIPLTDPPTFEARTYAKVSRRLIPFLMLCYLGAYLDRVNVGFAKLQMLNDLRFSETVYGMGAGIFFLGYFLFEVPSNLILHRVGARRWLARIMLTWAVISASFVFVKSPAAFYVLRFLLGVAEAGFAPGVILYLTYWYPSARRAKALSLFFMAIPLAGIVGGPLSGAIMHTLHGAMSMAGWKWLFLLEALPSLVLGVAILRYLDDGIAQAKWLSDPEKALLARNVAGDEAHKTAHLSICAIVALPLIGMSADRRRERRLHLAVPMLVAAAGFAALPALGSVTASIVCLSIAAAGILASSSQFWSLPTALLGGVSAAAGIAAVNCFANLAGFFSPAIVGWLNDLTGKSTAGLIFISAAVTLGAALVFAVPARSVNR
ncbi:MFS transporter [Burkholderia multivorans]|uniref:MFS transporter n=1 Tax=Burkholderia multivorans TaxID=87883 RepID=UPI0020A22789|nr:MFS transporter [Burkholderia multivorans]MCO8315126.1 MFS transporter [Burkholderia multivorans]MCO8425963.1 MFS transporter [Burkholderia multivorans]MCO8438635.1 MFS transporter [Burkholderia multivorans]MCO8543501.1 MFS transporter [Burkholderia multivorans]MCO8549993.1 MFS transporter [Burkholderia multivorans]